MNRERITEIVNNQREYYKSSKTLSYKFRKQQLKKLKEIMIKNQHKFYDALKLDLGKSSVESYMCEVGLVISELSYMIKNLKKLMKDKTVRTPLAHTISRSFIKNTPYGNVLIMSPWNYPVLLTLSPLVDAMAAGNTAIVKPSPDSKYTSQLIYDLLQDNFDRGYIDVILGDLNQCQSLLKNKFDHIFFTGSTTVGKIVMNSASEHATPITLELGGKCPCIIDSTANLKLSAKRIAFGKFLNVGQTCVAPDYILCHKDVVEQFTTYLKQEITKQYTEDAISNPNYGKIINKKHFDRLVGLIDTKKIVQGGDYDSKLLKIQPTVLEKVTYDDECMKQEIFGPILPIMTFDNVDQVVNDLKNQDEPLALYVYSKNKNNINKIISECQFGGGCINDCIVHLSTHYLPFGGVGQSGMGSYHGKKGFETFSHQKSILDKKLILDLPMRYQPYNKIKDKLIKFFVK